MLLTLRDYQPIHLIEFLQNVYRITTFIEDTKTPNDEKWWSESEEMRVLRVRLRAIASAHLEFYAAVGKLDLQTPPFVFNSLAEIVSPECVEKFLQKIATNWVSCLRRYTENLRTVNASESVFTLGRKLVTTSTSATQAKMEALQCEKEKQKHLRFAHLIKFLHAFVCVIDLHPFLKRLIEIIVNSDGKAVCLFFKVL